MRVLAILALALSLVGCNGDRMKDSNLATERTRWRPTDRLMAYAGSDTTGSIQKRHDAPPGRDRAAREDPKWFFFSGSSFT
jgi:hypothetical protein